MCSYFHLGILAIATLLLCFCLAVCCRHGETYLKGVNTEMNDLKQGDGVIAVCSDGKKRFGMIDGRFGSRLGVVFRHDASMPKPRFEFVNPENITPLYALGDGFDVLFDSNPYHYPNKASEYNWQS